MSPRGRNYGVRKVCTCGRRRWPKCPHAWNFNFKPRGGRPYRFSLDAELGRHLETKTAAETEASRIKAEILAGTFVRAADRMSAATLPATSGAITLDAFAAIYIERVSKASGKTSWEDDKSRLAQLCHHRASDGRRLGEWVLAAITEDEFEAFHASLLTKAANTRNHYVRIIKAACRWAARKGYLARSPISDDSALKTKKPARRDRRLSPDEEATLLAVAGAVSPGAGTRLQGLIIAAIETCCRLGELLGMQWADVKLERKELLIRAENAKDDESRRLPISTRLAAVLEMARTDPAGRQYGPAAYVFGKLGTRVKSVKKAWETCVLRAHGHEVTWTTGRKLSAESRAALRAIDLHFHDLRHEGGSRLLEDGWPLHHVRDMLGHASIETTDRYLNARRMGLHESMRRFEPTPRCISVADSPQGEQRLMRNGEAANSSKDLLH